MLKKRLVCVCLFGLILVSASIADVKATIDPSDIGIGAKPTGMGKAFTAVSGDINNIFINPAGLSLLQSVEVTSMYTNLLGDINYSLLGASYPTVAGTFGVGYVGVQTGDVIVTDLDTSGRPVPSGSMIGYSNNLVILSYGNKLAGWGKLWKAFNDMSVGLNVKLFSETFRGTGGQSALGTDLDLGITYMPRPYLTFGVLGKNILPYNSSFGGTLVWTNGTRESIPSLLKIGAAMKFFGEGAPKQWRGQDVLGSIDIDLNPNTANPSLMHMGIQWLPVKFLAIRTGIDQSYGGASVTPATNNLTAGVGLRLEDLSFDYAYRKDNVLNENSNHYISISYRMKSFVPKDKSKTAAQVKASAEAAVKSGLTIPDVPSNYWAKDAVDYVVNAKVLNIYQDGLFRPEKPITRADLAAMVVRVKFSGPPPAGTKEIAFKDVPNSYWAKNIIGVAAGQNLMKGYPDNTFKPNDKVSLLDATYAFTKLEKFAPADAPGIIKSAKDKGMLDFVKGPFAANTPVTRAQAAWMLYKLNN